MHPFSLGLRVIFVAKDKLDMVNKRSAAAKLRFVKRSQKRSTTAAAAARCWMGAASMATGSLSDSTRTDATERSCLVSWSIQATAKGPAKPVSEEGRGDANSYRGRGERTAGSRAENHGWLAEHAGEYDDGLTSLPVEFEGGL